MKTSNYWTIGKDNSKAVSIAGRAPDWYSGREYKKLAPKLRFFKKYKKDGDKEYYTEQYYKEVLNKLDPKKVYEELGEDAILLCHEKPNQFCHRHIVSKWLNQKLGLKITELK